MATRDLSALPMPQAVLGYMDWMLTLFLPHLPGRVSVRPSWLSPANLHLCDPLTPGEGDLGRTVGCGIFSAETMQGQLIT